MFKSKRYLSIFLVLILVASILTGCGEKQVATPEPTPAPAPAPTPPPEEKKLDPVEVVLKASENIMQNLPEGNYIIAPDKGLELLEDNPGAVFWIDMRSKEDYEKGHIDGAVNIPYAELGKNLDRVPMNKQVILQCYSGQTSAQAVAIFRMAGFNALSYRGGMKFGWSTLELPEDTLVQTPVELPAAQVPKLDEEGQILWDAAVNYFKPDTNFIIGTKELLELVEENPDAIMVLDIRSAEDFGKGHIEGAINIPFKEVGKNYDKLPKNKPVYIICYTGQTAGITTAMLRVVDINAISLNRGMTGWDADQLPKVN